MAGALHPLASRRVARRFRSTAVGLVAAVLAATLAALPAGAVTAPKPGTIQSWGDDGRGQLGNGAATGSSGVPVPVVDGHLVSVAAGAQHTVAATDAGAVLTWGDNSLGQLGIAPGGSADAPVLLEVAPGVEVTDVAAGDGHTVALTEDGRVFAWGDNDFGQASCAPDTLTNLCPAVLADPSPPTPVASLAVGQTVPAPLEDVVAIAAGGRHNLALDAGGVVWAWGDNREGQLGNGTIGVPRNPIAVPVLAIADAGAQLAAGDAHSLLLRSDNALSAWGANASGQLAQPLPVSTPLPTPITGLAGVTNVAAGGNHTLAIANGTVYAWGSNSAGQLGTATTSGSSSTPTAVKTGSQSSSPALQATRVAAGSAHSLAIKGDHTVFTWGADDAGQLGDGATNALRRFAAKINGIETATAVVAGGRHSIAVVAPVVRGTVSVSFGSQEVGVAGPPSVVTVENAGPGPLLIGQATTGDRQFSLGTDTCSSREIPAGATCTIQVRFVPADVDEQTGTLSFPDNSVDGVHTVPLAGVGAIAAGRLSLTVEESSVPAAPSSVPTSSFKYQAAAPGLGVGGLPLGSLGIGGLGLGSLGIGGLPLGSLGIGGLPLGSLGIGGLPLGSLGIGGLGLGSLGIGGLPLGSLGIGPIPVTAVPLRADRVPGGWATVLAGSRFDIRLLQDVTLGEVFASNPLPAGVAALTVADIDWTSSALSDLSPMTLVLGDTPTAAIGGIDWCPVLAAAGDPNCADAQRVSLLLLQLGQTTLPNELNAVRLGAIDLDGSYDFDKDGTVDRTTTPAPLWTFPLAKLDLQNSDFGAIRLVDIPNVGNAVDCTRVGCTSSTATLFDAGKAAALKPAATVANLGAAVANFTLAQAAFALLPGVFLGPVPADQAGVLTNASAPGLQLLHYHLLLTPESSSTTGVSSPAATIVLPSAVRIAPGSSSVRLGTSRTAVADPTVAIEGERMTLTWASLPSIGAGQLFALDFSLFPGLQTGPLAVTSAVLEAKVAPGAQAARFALTTPQELHAANVTIADGYFEPNDAVPAACGSTNRNQLTTGRVHYLHLSHRNDVEYLCFPAPAAGSIATVDVTPTDVDVDVALLYSKDMPRDLPLRQPKTTMTPLSSVGDRAASLHAGATIGSDNLDLPLPTGYGVADLSTQRGSVAENVAAVSPGATGFFIVQLTTHGGAISRKPVSVSLSIAPVAAAPAPAPRVYPFDASAYSGNDEGASAGVVPTSIPADTKTLLLVNRNAVNDEYGSAAATTLMSKLTSLVSFLGTANRAVVVGIDGDSAVKAALQAADAAPGDVALNNAVVRKTNDLVDRLVAASGAKLENIVLVGGPTQLRYPLVRDLTIQANERSFAGQLVKGAKTNALSAFLTAGFMPMDSAYCDLSPEPTAVGWRYVSGTTACGRLVESPAEIGSVIDRFIGLKGVLDLSTAAKALAVGSDFMNDLAATTDKLNDAAFDNRVLSGQEWNDANLQAALDGVRVASINTHFDTTRALPPRSDSPLFTVAKLDALTLPQLAFVSSIGCHAGLNDSDLLTTDASKVRDWTQAFTAKGVAYAAPSTYGLGITYDIGLHELLSKQLAANIATMKATGMTIGQALATAQQQYMSGRLAYGVYDDKVMSMGLFGLPLWKAAGAATSTPSAPTAPNGDDPYTGLSTTTITARPTFARTDTPDGAFYAADGGTQIVWDRPIQPSMQFGVEASAQGVLITSLTSTDVEAGSFNPLIARPQLSAATTPLPESQYISRFPESLAVVNSLETAAGNRANVVYSPGQFLDGRLVDKRVKGTQRLFPNATLQVLHAPAGDTDDVEPKASGFRGVILDGIAYFRVEASDQTATGGAGSVRRVLLQVQAGATWLPVDLAPGPDGVWTGAAALPAGTTAIEGFGQLVDASGNVGVFGPLEATGPSALPAGVSVVVDDLTVTVTEPLGVDVEVSIDGKPLQREGGGVLTIPDHDGLHVIDLVTSTGATGVHYAVRDTKGPQIGIFRPANGAHYVLDSVVRASYFCRDAATPVSSCAGTRANGAPIDTSTMGIWTFTSTAQDATGHTTTASTTYTVGYRFTGFFGLATEPVLNLGNAGRAIPVTWTMQDGSGAYVGDSADPWAHVTGLTWYQVQCPGGSPATNPAPSNDAGSSELRYDDALEQYQYNWKTEASWAGTCRRFLVTTDDGAVHTFIVRLS